MKTNYTGLEVAVVGMACKFPDANDPTIFWKNLVEGKESVRFFSEEELKEAGCSEELLNDPNFVSSQVTLDGKEFFDSNFFSYMPHEAKFMNPQTRIFHECTWNALEDAGYKPYEIKEKASLFAAGGDDMNWRLATEIINTTNPEIDGFSLGSLSNKDFLATYIAHKFNFLGEAVDVFSACSSSLLAIHLACRSLLTGSSKIALAGGVNVNTNGELGYLHQEGLIFSSDGHCRTFDAKSNGTVVGQGCGVVVLKRLKDALNEGDQIHAIIKGSASNNDGKNKVGFAAPSTQGQANCIRTALKFAKVPSESISYIEAHGTGTALGDPIEVEGLKLAFDTEKKHYCALGSVKSNIGHLDSAAGVASFIKTVLALKNKQIPASLHYEKPNPKIDFDNSPFFVNASLSAWDNPLKRAGVSSFGIGGTNVHMILEEAPEPVERKEVKKMQVLVASGKTQTAAQSNLSAIVEFAENTKISIDDLAYQLQVNRTRFNHSYFKVQTTNSPLTEEGWHYNNGQIAKNTSTVFLFPGQGAEYANFFTSMYHEYEQFRKHVDACFELIEANESGLLKNILFSQDQTIADQVHSTQYTQTLLFVMEYSLGKFLMELGIQPTHVIGHSLGELVGACLAGVFSLHDGLRLVQKRGQLMAAMSKDGSMLCVFAGESKIQRFLNPKVELAAVNSGKNIVLSGDKIRLEEIKEELKLESIPSFFIQEDKAFHSRFVDEILDDYRAFLEQVEFKEPSIPVLSTVHGRLAKVDELTKPDYWVQQVRTTVRFANAISSIQQENVCFIEVGPGQALTNFVKQMTENDECLIVPFGRKSTTAEYEMAWILEAVGTLWSHGKEIDWKVFYAGENRIAQSVPTYCFDKLSYPATYKFKELIGEVNLFGSNNNGNNVTDWLHTRSWKSESLPNAEIDLSKERVLVVGDESQLLKNIVEQLQQYNTDIINNAGMELSEVSVAVKNLKEKQWQPTRLILVFDAKHFQSNNDFDQQAHAYLTDYYVKLIELVRSLNRHFDFNENNQLSLDFVTNDCYQVIGNETVVPYSFITIGALKVLTNEIAHHNYRILDLDNTGSWIREFGQKQSSREVAYRFGKRWVAEYQKLKSPEADLSSRFKKGGRYLISGGTRGMGKEFALHLAEKYEAELILLARSAPNPDEMAEFEQKAAKLDIILCDVSDEKKLIHELDAVKGKEITGILHCAGVTDLEGLVMAQEDKINLNMFAPKLLGTNNLLKYYKDASLDFFMASSSLSSTIGSPGFIGYVAANSYLDGLAQSNYSFPIISIQWNGWRETGMMYKEGDTTQEQGNSLSNSEGIKILEAMLSSDVHFAVVSQLNLEKLIEDAKVRKNIALGHTVVSESTGFGERPSLAVPLKAPETETQKKLTELWEGFLGIKPIGVHDDFFELGGSSLTAMNLITRIHKAFDVELEMGTLFTHATIEKLAESIDNLLWVKQNENSFDNELVI